MINAVPAAQILGPITIEIFGSLISGLADVDGADLDLSLSRPGSIARWDVLFYLREIYKLMKSAGVPRVHTRADARVPIAHIHIDNLPGFYSGVDVDVSIANHQGVENSALLAQCVEGSPFMAPLTLFMKTLLKRSFKSCNSGNLLIS